MEDFGTYRQS